MDAITLNGRKPRWASLLLLPIFILTSVPQAVWADSTAGSSAAVMSFMEEESQAAASITKVSASHTPAAVTVITAEDIAITPARNMLDLLEVYVPGFVYNEHVEGPHPAMRGIASDRNYKILLLVNGVNMNEKAHNGAVTELENWDLNDIAKIEVIRGPGSVTYGPGAIMGVISITTKDAGKAPGLDAGAQFYSGYNSAGAHLAYGKTTDNYKLYLYASAVNTQGEKDPSIFTIANNNNYGYIGQNFPPGTTNANTSDPGNPPQPYMKDGRNIPQKKFFLDLDFANEWKFWMRYNNAGATQGLNPQSTLAPNANPIDSGEDFYQYATAALEDKHQFSDKYALTSRLSFGSKDEQKTSAFAPGGALSPDINSPLDYRDNFSETTVLLHELLNYKLDEKNDLALGMEYSYDYWGAAWGQPAGTLRMGESTGGGGAIVSGPNDPAYFIVNKPVTVGSGWGTSTYSLFGEANLNPAEHLNVIVSARGDKNDFSTYLFSPRLALISDWDQKGVYKLLIQQSVRMNTAEQLLQQHVAGGSAQNEKLDTIELDYVSPKFHDTVVNANVFYNDLHALGFNAAANSTTAVGEQRLWGVELEAKYEAPKYTVGANHSFTQQISYKLDPNVVTSNISYANYNLATGGFVFTGAGNAPNNWSDNTTKLFANYKLNDQVTLHADTRVLWGFQGEQNAWTVLQIPTQGTATGQAIQNAINAAKAQGAYGIDFRLDASVAYKITPQLTGTLYGQNLASPTGNKRYALDGGVSAAADNRLRYIDEPTVVGLAFTYKTKM